MAVTPSHVVLVTRDGTLGGDQLFLLYFLRWLTSSTAVRTEILTWHEGTLTEDLREVTEVRSMDELDRWRPARVFEVLRVQRAAQVLKAALSPGQDARRDPRFPRQLAQGLAPAGAAGVLTEHPHVGAERTDRVEVGRTRRRAGSHLCALIPSGRPATPAPSAAARAGAPG